MHYLYTEDVRTYCVLGNNSARREPSSGWLNHCGRDCPRLVLGPRNNLAILISNRRTRLLQSFLIQNEQDVHDQFDIPRSQETNFDSRLLGGGVKVLSASHILVSHIWHSKFCSVRTPSLSHLTYSSCPGGPAAFFPFSLSPS